MSLTPKLDVLKRYKSNPKRKKNHHKNKDSCGKLKVVVDSDVYLPTNNNSNFDISDIEEDIDEDAPVIAEIIDERPEHFKATDDLFEKSKWRAIEKPRGMQDPVKFHLNPKSVKLNVGDRLSSNRLKAAKKASEYAKLLTASQSVNESSNKSNVNTVSNWRNIEVIPDSSISISNPNESLAKASVEKPENEDDNDSDLSPDRPTESARADLRSRRTTGDTTIRRDQQQQDNIQKEELKLERENQYKIWSKGIVQLNNYEQQNKLLDTSKEESFTRHKDDKELDEFLKSQERQGDPMANFFRNKQIQKSNSKDNDLSNSNKIRQKCKFPTTPNRFGIEAGFRWDGVDRSNGFEGKLISAAAGKKSIAEHAYKWRVEDM